MRAYQILRHKRIALDTNVFLAAMDPRPTENRVPRDFFARAGRSTTTIVTSTMTYVEALVRPYQLENAELVQAAIAAISGDSRVSLVPLTEPIALRAAQLRAQFLNQGRRLASPDAVHLATAIDQGASLFVTNDRDFPATTVEGVRIVRLTGK